MTSRRRMALRPGWILLCALLVPGWSLLAQAPPGVEVSVLEDTDRSLDFARAKNAPQEAFRPVGSPDRLTLGFSPSRFYLRIRVPSSVPENPLRVEIQNPFLEHVIFSPGDQTNLLTVNGGTSSLNPEAFPSFLMPPGGPGELWILVDSRTPYRIPLSIQPRSNWQESDRTRDLIPFLLLGASVALFVYYLTLWIMTRDLSCLAFLPVILFLVIYRSSFHGLPLYVLKPHAGSWLLPITIVAADLTMAAATVWAITFFRDLTTPRWFALALRGFLGLLLVQLGFSMGFPFHVNKYLYLSSAVFSVLMIIYGLIMLRKGFQPALFFVLSCIALPFGTAIATLHAMGHNMPSISSRAIDLAALTQLLLMAISIGQKFRVKMQGTQDELTQKVEERTIALQSEVMARREAQEQAEQASRAKSAFLAAVSHELRTPMNVILGVGDLLSESTSFSRADQHAVALLRQSGHALLQIINDVLDTSRLDIDQVHLNERPFRLREWLANMSAPFVSMMKDTDVEFRIVIEESIPDGLFGDAERLAQILINLLSNAAKFTRKGSIALTVSSRPGPEKEELLFVIQDTGIGIPLMMFPYIFERFSPANAATAAEFGGTGLGLFLARSFARLMGGDILAESEPGHGSRFSVHIPLRRSENTAPEFIPGIVDYHLPVSVLIAEDQPENRLLFERYLEGKLKQLSFARDGKEAVELFTANLYDIVFLDIRMPIKDGYAALEGIRQHEMNNRARKRPVLALTAYAFDSELDRIRAAGFTDVLTKPVCRADLLQAIERHTREK